tara:strand:+ start:845 stop:1693 length:849 start_codon:yes stop_codon:yes gene_type:complete
MKRFKNVFFFIFLIVFAICENEKKIVTIGGAVTESVFSLGLGQYVVAVDQSSLLPESVNELPQVGYIRAISAEGVLSMYPDLILTTTDIGPPNVVQQIQSAGVDIEVYNSPYSFKNILELIESISIKLNAENKGQAIIKDLKKIDNEVSIKKSQYIRKPKIAFFMNPSKGSYNAAGAKTKANYLIQYIGGDNIFQDDFDKYSKVTPETIISKNPDIILVGSYMGKSEADLYKLFNDVDSFEYLNAVSNDKVIYIDIGKSLIYGPSFAINALRLIDEIDFEIE